MFTNKYPYLDFHELNLDYVLKQIEDFRQELNTLEDRIYQRVMAPFERASIHGFLWDEKKEIQKKRNSKKGTLKIETSGKRRTGSGSSRF